MDLWIFNNETAIRLSCFLGIFFLMAILEIKYPRRQYNLKQIRGIRWLNNIVLAATSSILSRLILPLGLISFAIQCQTSTWGLFNQDFSVSLNYTFVFIISLIIFDFIIYWQHRLFHKIPLLWRLHKVHHCDQTFDVTTGIRFHPLEILLSIGIKFLAVFIFGFSPISIIVFEILLNAVALFNHSNVKIPLSIDHFVRRLIVTPDMHRVHHSQIPSEFNSNFGFNISLWDRIFHSYKGQPMKGHQAIQIGLKEFRINNAANRLLPLLIMPFITAARDEGNRKDKKQD